MKKPMGCAIPNCEVRELFAKLGDEGYSCPHCYWELQHDTLQHLYYCPNEMCLNETQYVEPHERVIVKELGITLAHGVSPHTFMTELERLCMRYGQGGKNFYFLDYYVQESD